MLRLPGTHPRSLICFVSGVHATLLGSCLAACAPRRSESLLGQGRCSTGDPNCRLIRVDVSGISQVPRRSILCLCPVLRPRPNRRPLAYLTVSSMLPPLFQQRRLQRLMNFGALLRGFSTCCLRFKSDVATTHAKLASGWLARLYREGVEPSGSLQKVSDHTLVPLFWIYPGATEVSWRSRAVPAREQSIMPLHLPQRLWAEPIAAVEA